jgi:5-methylcytosine-specific restriction endonuclease McrA
MICRSGQEKRNDSEYKKWRKNVWLLDDFKCKIDNPDCAGRIEVHHIFGWTEYPELRYKTNNGITLCHAHHPKTRAEEKRLVPYFQELVSVSRK